MESLAMEVLFVDGFTIAGGASPVGGRIGYPRWFEVRTGDLVVGIRFGGDTVFCG